MGKVLRITLILVAVCLCAIGPSHAAQHDVMTPAFTAEWHPVLGSGGAYQAQTAGQQPTIWEMTVVGREGEGYWIEMYLPGMQTVMKSLASPRGVARVIVKTEGQPAMEMPASLMGVSPKMDVKETGQYLGEEQVTTQAGTFACKHYRVTESSGPADVWVATDVSPYGLVKMTSSEVTMTLQRIITGAKTRITETPQPFQMPQMPNMPGASSSQQMPDMSALMQALQQQGR